MNWIRVRHDRTGHETTIPARAVDGYRRRGWALLDEPEALAAPEPVEPDEHDHEIATPTGGSDDDSKEIEQ